MRAVITGIYGQDGSFLCEILQKKGYEVHGIIREELSIQSLRNKNELENKGLFPIVHIVDIYDFSALSNVLLKIKPDEVYHVAAQHISAQDRRGLLEENVLNANILATYNVLEVCSRYLPKCKIVTAGSCLMYDNVNTFPQSEITPYNSRSYYGIGKIAENMIVKKHRLSGMFSCTAILYNHESHRRSDSFVTKKIANSLRLIKKGEIDCFELGTLETLKDWGYAGDYAYGMYLMLQQEKPRDYILATNSLHSIEDFVEECSKQLGIDHWRDCVEINDKVLTRNNSTILVGDYSKALTDLGWKHTLSFSELVSEILGGCVG